MKLKEEEEALALQNKAESEDEQKSEKPSNESSPTKKNRAPTPKLVWQEISRLFLKTYLQICEINAKIL